MIKQVAIPTWTRFTVIKSFDRLLVLINRLGLTRTPISKIKMIAFFLLFKQLSYLMKSSVPAKNRFTSYKILWLVILNFQAFFASVCFEPIDKIIISDWFFFLVH